MTGRSTLPWPPREPAGGAPGQSPGGEQAPLRLLVVDDDAVDRMAVRRAIAATGLVATVEEAPDAETALAVLTALPSDCVLLDYQLPGRSGLELLKDIRRRGLDVPVIMLTGRSDPETAVELMKAGAADFLSKSVLAPDRLGPSIRNAVRVSRAERALRESQAWASTALRSIGDAVVTTDAHGRVTYLNRVAEELTGWAAGDASGRPLVEVADVSPEGGGVALHERVAQVLADHTSASQGDMVLRARDGHRVSVDVRVARIRGDRIDGAGGGSPATAVGVVVALHDITDRKGVEAALEEARADAERARAEAEAANHAKSEFLATMSHELRTPLNAIGGFAQLIADGIYGSVEPRQTEALGRIKRAQELLLGLINAVLNFAKVQAGHVSLDVADFGIRPVLEDVRVLVLPPMQAKHLEFTVGEASDAQASARGDREKVQQILLNLLSNAAKFTSPGGRVTVDWRRVGDMLNVTVTDTGIGIPSDKINLVFEPFVQLGSDRTTIGQGTGLGLAISRELARSMNGDLSATSEPGTGSAFTLSLPAARAGR
ncbi:MAG TPA: ATP-binding protein [Gemmatimonadaceae bacterium]